MREGSAGAMVRRIADESLLSLTPGTIANARYWSFFLRDLCVLRAGCSPAITRGAE